MKIEINECGFDRTLTTINNALRGALNTTNRRKKDECINLALGAVIALEDLALVWDDEPQTNSESTDII